MSLRHIDYELFLTFVEHNEVHDGGHNLHADNFKQEAQYFAEEGIS